MIIVVAALEFTDQKARDSAIEITSEVQLRTRNQESGCRDYCFAADPAVATRIQVYELWEDSESLAQHFQHPYYDEMAELLQGIGIVSSTNRAYLIEKEESVYTEKGEKKRVFFDG